MQNCCSEAHFTTVRYITGPLVGDPITRIEAQFFGNLANTPEVTMLTADAS